MKSSELITAPSTNIIIKGKKNHQTRRQQKAKERERETGGGGGGGNIKYKKTIKRWDRKENPWGLLPSLIYPLGFPVSSSYNEIGMKASRGWGGGRGGGGGGGWGLGGGGSLNGRVDYIVEVRVQIWRRRWPRLAG